MENSINIFLVENYFLKRRQWEDGERMTLKNGDTLQNGKTNNRFNSQTGAIKPFLP